MGTCFPNTILGQGGYLATHQSCLRKLSLVTPSVCTQAAPPLSQFVTLQDLSWKGSLSDDDCRALKDFFLSHHEKLTSLEIDFVDWEETEDFRDLFDTSEEESTPLANLILPKRDDNYTDFMPKLQSVSFSAASFLGSVDRLVNAFNFPGVRALRLLNCKFADVILIVLGLKDIKMQANRVELVIRCRPTAGRILSDFLASFDSLKDLFIMFEARSTDRYHGESILRHRNTLRRLVYHRRFYCSDRRSPYHREWRDYSLGEGRKTDKSIINIFEGTRLESAGFCDEPSHFRQNLKSIAYRVISLTLLHLRFTGKETRKPKFFHRDKAFNTRSPDLTEAEDWRVKEEEELEDFANWAFGPHGFPGLKVLASGDFSHGRRFADTHTLWCRETTGSTSGRMWRFVVQSDIAENELINANMDMLSACPVSPLFYYYGRKGEFPGMS